MLTVDERYGDVMCKQLNESVSAMTFRVREAQQAPLYLVCRTAVARAFDHISLAELRLRRNLQLAHNELLKQRSTFCSVNSCSPSPSDSSDSSLEHYVLDVISECSVEETLDETLSSVEAPVQFRLMEQYRDKLYGKVYEILCDLVESLQPVMTHEGVDLNPFHRPVADRE
nr:hypothetical protein BaRGS_004970 [Batillaria attramentaria]